MMKVPAQKPKYIYHLPEIFFVCFKLPVNLILQIETEYTLNNLPKLLVRGVRPDFCCAFSWDSFGDVLLDLVNVAIFIISGTNLSWETFLSILQETAKSFEEMRDDVSLFSSA